MERPDVERLIVNASFAEQRGFAQSPAGSALAERIMATPQSPVSSGRRRLRMRMVLIGAGLGMFIALGAGAAVATYQAPTVPSDWQPPISGAATFDHFMCATSGLKAQSEVPAKIDESPIDACRSNWSNTFGQSAPTHLFACVSRVGVQPTRGVGPSVGSAGRLIYILDGDQFKNAPETCGSVGMFVAPAGLGEGSLPTARPTRT